MSSIGDKATKDCSISELELDLHERKKGIMTEKERHQRFSDICCELREVIRICLQGNCKLPKAMILSVLPMHPELLGKLFYQGTTLISLFLRDTHVDIKDLKSLCQLYKDNSMPVSIHETADALCDACRYDVADEFLEYLVDQFPDSIWHQDDASKTPLRTLFEIIHFEYTNEILNSDKRLKQINILIGTEPRRLQSCDDDHSWLLIASLKDGFGSEIMHYLFETYPAVSESGLSLSSAHEVTLGGRNFALREDHAHAIAKGFSHFGFFDACCDAWTLAGYRLMIEHIYTMNPEIAYMHFPIIPDFLRASPDAQKQLYLYITKQDTHLCAALGFEVYPAQDSAITCNNLEFEFCKSCILSNPGIHEFYLYDFKGASSHAFSSLLSTTPLKTACFSGLSLAGPWASCSSSNMEDMKLVRCDFESDGMRGFLLQLSELSNLKRVSFNLSSAQDTKYVAEGLACLLKEDNIESIVISYDQRDIKGLLNAINSGLLTNTSLKKLEISFRYEEPFIKEELISLVDVLKHHNTSLESLTFYDNINERDVIHDDNKLAFEKCKYFTALNKFGPWKAQQVHTTLDEFFGLLCNVATAFTAYDNPEALMDKFNIQYGLLMECPGLWS
jgi:hypothetical protein